MVAPMLRVAAFALPLIFVVSAAGRCIPCVVTAPFVSPARCIPNGGILLFNSVPPNVPAYWTLFADTQGARSRRRLAGDLDVFSDSVDPGVPGFPGTLTDGVYVGTTAHFEGRVRQRRVVGAASYPDGSTCEFRLELDFGLGTQPPNAFVCRNPAGDVIAQGAVDLQGIRLQGCRRGRPGG